MIICVYVFLYIKSSIKKLETHIAELSVFWIADGRNLVESVYIAVRNKKQQIKKC